MKQNIIILVLMTLTASGCNLSRNEALTADQVLTQAAETASFYLTATKFSEPVSTSTPLPTATPEATATSTMAIPTLQPATPVTYQYGSASYTTTSCDLAAFVADVTIADGTELDPGEEFTKTWKISNAGTCTWDEDYSLVFYSGEQMDGPDSQALTDEDISPGESLKISVDLVAPTTSGYYYGYWRLENSSGVEFGLDTSGTPFYVYIYVGSSATTTATPTATTTTTSSTSTATTAPTATSTTIANTATPTKAADAATPVPTEEATLTEVEETSE